MAQRGGKPCAAALPWLSATRKFRRLMIAAELIRMADF